MEFLSLAGSYSKPCWRRGSDLPRRDWAQPCPIFSHFASFWILPSLDLLWSPKIRPGFQGEQLGVPDLFNSLDFYPIPTSRIPKGLGNIWVLCCPFIAVSLINPLGPPAGEGIIFQLDVIQGFWGFSSFFLPPDAELFPTKPRLLQKNRDWLFFWGGELNLEYKALSLEEKSNFSIKLFQFSFLEMSLSRVSGSSSWITRNSFPSFYLGSIPFPQLWGFDVPVPQKDGGKQIPVPDFHP